MNILHLNNVPIFEQLQLEEALLRADIRNVCIINEGSSPAVVMGISGKAEELIDLEKLEQNPIPVIKRYSGGGTVVVDPNTVFVSFICNKDLVDFEPFPEPLMRWSAGLYKQALPQIDFDLRENDYVIGPKKVGGNAQYLTKTRFVHHTTFLWDYEKSLMDLLRHPKKTPSYREGRSHGEFVTRLCEHLDQKEDFVSSFKAIMCSTYHAAEIALEELAPAIDLPHRKSTQLLTEMPLSC